MQQAEFEAELKAKGFVEIESKSIDPRPTNHGHTHDYDISGLVLSGVFIVNQGDKPITYLRRHLLRARRAEPHRGDRRGGAKIVVGRKY